MYRPRGSFSGGRDHPYPRNQSASSTDRGDNERSRGLFSRGREHPYPRNQSASSTDRGDNERPRGSFSRGREHPHPRNQSASSTDRGDNERRFQVEAGGERSRGRGGFRGGRGSNTGYGREDQFVRGAYQHNEAAVGDRTFDRNTSRGNNGSQVQESGVSEDRQDYTPKLMTYGRLKTWADMTDAGELVLFMSTQRQQIETFLNQPTIKRDWLTLLVKSINHAITAQHQRGSIKHLLDNLCRSRFFEHFATYIEEMHLLGLIWEEAEEFFKSLMDIMAEVLNKCPQYAIKCNTGASTLLNNAPHFDSIKNNKDLLDSITDFSKRAKEVYLEEKEKEKSGTFLGNRESEKPLDNFIDIPVVPTQLDLRADAQPFIRSAKTVGEYDDVQHYLDVQFRLMRQDFIFPLREGIIEFKKNGCNKNHNCSNLRMYYDVHIVGNVFKDGIDHILQFDISKLKNVKWEFSKRLIFGSLLCLSKDNFETVLFATVANRDAKNLAKGTVNVNFKTDLDVVFNSTSSDVYVMAETTAYFESYCHVLEGLKEMTKTLPLQDYIIKCKKEIKPPRYLLPLPGQLIIPTYDLSALLQSKTPLEVPVLTTVKWPDTDVMCLNKSQKEAAILALTKELAVIQGPPGTGKTYVGLKVMQVLIENMKVISRNEENKSSPILVVCYTNHALDQFLEGVLEFCPKGIVRVGGRNSSEKLEQFNLKNLKQKLRKDKLFSNLSVRKSMHVCRKELAEASDSIIDLNQIMDSLETDVVSETVLEDVMKETHYMSLTRQNSQPALNEMHLRNWLNSSNNTPETIITQMIKRHLTILILQWREVSLEMKLTADMTIFQRASFYHGYLDLYKQDLMQERQFILNQGFVNFLGASRINEIKECLDIAQRRILHDVELERVIPYEVINTMVSFFRISGRQETINIGGVVETWLLGLDENLHSQLDDVQMLANFLSGEMIGSEMFDDDDASRQIQNDRMVDDDEDDDEDDHQNYYDRSKAAMGNISSVIQRADMLGIKETILMEEEGYRVGDNDGGEWEEVSYTKPMSFIKFQKKLKATNPMTEEKESSIENVWELDLDQRFALYNLWIKKYKETLTINMHELVKSYTSAFERKKEANTEEILFILRSAKVIGMTTTGAAKHRALLQSLGCRIIVVEEAAEVLESHIVTSLNKNCKHLILIGDHQQLRPSPTVFVLAKEYGLEISLFERLIKNKVPHVLLKEQHRMRPEISKIMCHIYPDLQDHVSVKGYDNIRGVAKNMFFIQHEHKETHVDDSRSKANIHEAQFIVALCQYLLNQGYKESEITILATYAGQVFAIKKIIKEEAKFDNRVRVTAVDNFQGEENEIILLSLVRSNTENNVGFLKVDNRVCVALSRARKGLFVTGNFDLLASQSKLWKNIVETMSQEQLIGGALPVVCQQHLEFQESMTCAEDFKKRPDGGCGRDCEYKLMCGHTCGRKCHGFDLEHTDYQCRKSCSKQCALGHPCQKKCYQSCGDCMVIVQKQIPVCGHDDDVPCSVPPIRADCSQKCSIMLDCEHACTGKCGQCRKNKKHEQCVVQITYSWPCGHSATVPCYRKPTLYPCEKLCGADLECGHKCTGTCSGCLQGSVHVACVKKCVKRLPCGHTCPSFCGVPCLPCTKVCPAVCHHSACFKAKPPPLCSHRCALCKEPCRNQCSHKKCHKLCSDVCDLGHCLQICRKRVETCKHLCSGICGELCVCAKCEKISILRDDNKKDELLAPGEKKKNIAAHNAGSSTAEALVTQNQSKLIDSRHTGSSTADALVTQSQSKLIDSRHTGSSTAEALVTQNQSKLIDSRHTGSSTAEALVTRSQSKLIDSRHTGSSTAEALATRGQSKLKDSRLTGSSTAEALATQCQSKLIDSRLTGSSTAEALVTQSQSKLKGKRQQTKRRLVIKNPPCLHVFYVDELDKYVLNFDPDGSSYIFCPICPKPILKCFRYENINKKRQGKREEMKTRLKSVTNVTMKQMACLQMSQTVLEDSLFMRGFRKINIKLIRNQLEMEAVSFKLKCAFMLSEIVSLMETSSGPTQSFRAHKDAVLAIKNRLTIQQKSEFTTELLRCFWECYLAHLESLASQHDIDVPEAMMNTVRETQEELKKPKPNGDMLTRAENVAAILRRRIKETSKDEMVKARCLLLEEAPARAVKVMQSRDEDMLFDLIGGGIKGILKRTQAVPLFSSDGHHREVQDHSTLRREMWSHEMWSGKRHSDHRTEVASTAPKRSKFPQPETTADDWFMLDSYTADSDSN